MYFSWNEDTIRWFLSASTCTGFHRELATRLRPWLTPGGTLVDLGCGAGLIDLELASHAGCITCIDRAEAPLAFLREEAARRGISNVETLCRDVHDVSGLWDDVLMNFFGSGTALVDQYLPLCCNRLVAVIRSGSESVFGPSRWRERHRDLLSLTRSDLDARGVSYILELGELEFGQPLKSQTDSVSFVRSSCSPDVPDCEVDAYLEKHLRPQSHPSWPFYLPNRKQFGIFIIPRQENEHLLPSERRLWPA